MAALNPHSGFRTLGGIRFVSLEGEPIQGSSTTGATIPRVP